MRFRLIPFLVLAGVFFAPTASHAAAGGLGNEEEIHKLQDVEVTGPNGEPLFLGYKTTTFYLIGGVYFTDDGYVFGLRSDDSKFIDTTPEEIAKFQASGLLPDPLPPYKLGTMAYILGYSLWIIVLPILIIYFGVAMLRKRKAAPPKQGQPPA